MAIELEQLTKQVQKLPTLNQIALQVIQLCADPDVSISQLVKVISVDQSLSSQILRIANSSFFNYPRTISTLERAIVVLGFNLLRDIAVSVAIYSFYKGFPANLAFDLQGLWRHSLTTAFAGRAVAEKMDPAHRELLYMGGLLHDLGKVIELRLMPEDFLMLVEKSHQEGLRLDVVEQRLLGFHHGEVGAILLDHWNLPEPLVVTVRFHHQPEAFQGEAREGALVRQVYLANILAHYLEGEPGGLEKVIQYDPDFPRYISLSEDELIELSEYAQEILGQNKGLFEIIQSS